MKTGACLTVQLMTVNGKELGAQEWRDDLFLGYGLDPPDLPKLCDGCNSALLIFHSLYCKKGGLVTLRQNELCDGVAYMAGKYFTSMHVRNDSLIFAGRAIQRP